MNKQFDRMEDKLDELISATSKNTKDLSWIKKVGGLIISAIAFLFSKHLGGP